jgi:Domain of unknown function (DUF1707)
LNQVYVDIFGSPSTYWATILTMTDFSDPAGSQLRLSNAERDEAVSSLQAHAHDGRLSDAELASRISAARVAVTRGDLAPLFIDLPHPSTTGRFDNSAPNSAGFAPPSDGDYRQSGPRSGPGVAFATITPIVCVVLFFFTGLIWGYQFAWLWFLAVPIAWTLVYGIDGGRGRNRGRDRYRYRDRDGR